MAASSVDGADCVLLVDDDQGFRTVYRRLLGQDGYAVVEAKDPTEALTVFRQSGARLAIVDLMLPPSGQPEEGAKVCERMLSERPETKVILVSGTADTEVPLSIVRKGAYDFISKPVDPDVLLHVLSRAKARLTLEDEVKALSSDLESQFLYGRGPLGESKALVEARLLAERAAPTDVPVLLTGETGTGKEVFARYIHQQSLRSNGPFVAINCGALPEGILESSLFGHRKGAFTGAVRDAKGLFVEAHNGSLFLDELGDMPASLQVKLLRVLETGEVYPVGATQPVTVDVRIISATHQPLLDRIAERTFREDLYYRIRGIEVALPRLSDRSGDIALLAQHFVNQARQLVPHARTPHLSPELVRKLETYAWPGNLRELRTEMQRALVMAGGRSELLVDDVSPALALSSAERSDENAPSDDLATLEQKISWLEQRELRAALKATGGNKSQAAQRLGLSRQGLLNKLARHRID